MAYLAFGINIGVVGIVEDTTLIVARAPLDGQTAMALITAKIDLVALPDQSDLLAAGLIRNVTAQRNRALIGGLHTNEYRVTGHG